MLQEVARPKVTYVNMIALIYMMELLSVPVNNFSLLPTMDTLALVSCSFLN